MPQFSELYTRPQSFYPQKGEYDPGQAFQAFLGHTDQKDRHLCFMDSLFSGLIEQNVIQPNEAVTFIDLACGDGQSSKNMLEALATKTSGSLVNYIGIDADSRFVSSGTDTMRDIKEGVKNIIQADIFEGDTLPLKQTDNAIVYIGHALYYGGSEGEHLGALASKVNAVLGEHAVCITAHNGADCQLAAIRSQVAKDVLPTPSEKFATEAEKSGMSFTEKDATATLRFPRLTPEERKNLSDPDAWQQHNRPEFSEALRLLSFVAQQALPAPSGITLTSEQESMPRLTREELSNMVNRIYGSERDKDQPELNIISNYQIFTSQQRSTGIGESVKIAINNAEPEGKASHATLAFGGGRGL